ncbi:MAG: SDR family oxidoreductase, partial [Gammaproteobacteria bacterium]|nr:SDR family oxidoreductase [Gammaproteobacteria bacterium]
MTEQPVVVITGSAGGIGAAAARVFAAAGWHVVGVDRAGGAPPDGVARFVQVDIADEAANRAIFEGVAAQEGRLDALVNNAAIQIAKRLVETEPAEWDQVMASNVRAVYLAIRHAHPLLKQSGGSIVNVSSVHAVATSVGLAA